MLSKVERPVETMYWNPVPFSQRHHDVRKLKLVDQQASQLGMIGSLQGVFLPVEISGFTNRMACQRCDLVKSDHASANLLLRKQMLL